MKVRKAIVVVLLLLAAYVLVYVLPHGARVKTSEVRTEEPLDCVIMLDNGLFSPEARHIGFHYELLQHFCREAGHHYVITSRVASDTCWNDLACGRTDILVLSPQDTIPERWRGSMILSLPIKEDYRWAVPRDRADLMGRIHVFLYGQRESGNLQRLQGKYFRSYRIEPHLEDSTMVSALSPYDEWIRAEGFATGIDWRLLSAIIYQESRFNPATSSSRNAVGLMQVLPSTAYHYGVDDPYDPKMNIHAGSRHFARLVRAFSADYPEDAIDSVNVLRLALAAYNAGETRIRDFCHITDSLGRNGLDWDEVRLTIDSDESFNGRQTADYVDLVLERYNLYRQVIE